MEEFDYKELQNIPIPEGLEERLSNKIDEWEVEEHRNLVVAKRGKIQKNWKRISGIAASVAIMIGLGAFLFNQNATPNGHTDTYSDPEIAYAEAENALNLLAANLNKGMDQIDLVSEKSQKAGNMLNN